MAIVGAAYARSYAVKLKPRREGNRLSVSLDLGFGTAGSADAMGVVAVIGILSAVAVPAFMDYMKKSKKTEASLQLNKIAKNSKVVYATDASFVVGTATARPTTMTACKGVVDTTWAADAVWAALDFQVDEPNLFKYGYVGAATSASANAVGDLDCDTTMITYTLNLTAPSGNASAIIVEPAPNSD